MKRRLLLGTALAGTIGAAGAAAAGPAGSGDNYSVTLAGRLDYSAVAYDQDRSTGKGRGYGLSNDEAEFYVRARATADNGITYGVDFELNANENDVTAADEAYAYAENQARWGRVEMGDNDSAADRMAAHPYNLLAGRSGWDASEVSDYINEGSALITSDVSIASDDTKVIYFTPRFAGFQLGASLTPDTGVNGRNGSATDNDGDTNNLWSFGANYTGRLGGIELEVAGTYETGDRPNGGSPAFTATEDTEVWSASVRVSIDSFDIGAAYVDNNETGITSAAAASGADAGTYYNAAVGYGAGPWRVSLGYYHSNVANGGGIADTRTDMYVLGATYQVAPGWRLQSDLDFIDIENWNGATVPNLDNQATLLIVTNRFDF